MTEPTTPMSDHTCNLCPKCAGCRMGHLHCRGCRCQPMSEPTRAAVPSRDHRAAWLAQSRPTGRHRPG
jgi:hypothetical protein